MLECHTLRSVTRLSSDRFANEKQKRKEGYPCDTDGCTTLQGSPAGCASALAPAGWDGAPVAWDPALST